MEVSCGTVWNDCLEVIRENVGEENFNTWFKPISPLRVDGDVLTIQVPSQFFYEWLEDNYVPVLKRAIHTVLGPTGRLNILLLLIVAIRQTPPVSVNYPVNGAGNQPKRCWKWAFTADEYSPFSFKALNPQTVNSRLNATYTSIILWKEIVTAWHVLQESLLQKSPV